MEIHTLQALGYLHTEPQSLTNIALSGTTELVLTCTILQTVFYVSCQNWSWPQRTIKHKSSTLTEVVISIIFKHPVPTCTLLIPHTFVKVNWPQMALGYLHIQKHSLLSQSHALWDTEFSHCFYRTHPNMPTCLLQRTNHILQRLPLLPSHTILHVRCQNWIDHKQQPNHKNALGYLNR